MPSVAVDIRAAIERVTIFFIVVLLLSSFGPLGLPVWALVDEGVMSDSH